MTAVRRVAMILDTLDHGGAVFAAANLLSGFRACGARTSVVSKRSGARAQLFAKADGPVICSSWIGWPLAGSRVLAPLRGFDPQVLHVQSLRALPLGLRIARELHKPLAVTVNRLAGMDLERLRAAPDVAVIAVSLAVQEALTNRGGIPRDRVCVIPNGINLAAFPFAGKAPDDLTARLPVIGCFGHLREEKGQRTFLQMARQLLDSGADAEFLILGEGPDKAMLRNLAAQLNLSSRLTFAPASAAESGALDSIDIFVEPTTREGFGLSVLQAMARGIPVVACGVGGVFDLVEDGETGLLVGKNDPEAMAAAIRRLLEHPLQRGELIRNARERVERSFSASIVARRVLDVLATLT